MKIIALILALIFATAHGQTVNPGGGGASSSGAAGTPQAADGSGGFKPMTAQNYSTTPINAWTLNLNGQTFYAEGSSITRGYTLNTAQLPNGGLTGNYFDIFCKSVWSLGHATCYNDGVDGSTTTQALQRYTTGNSQFGVTVPSPHSLSPAVTGNTNRAIFFLDLTPVFNDANQATPIPVATSISNLQSIVNNAKQDGYFIVVFTSPVVTPNNSAGAVQVNAANQAVRNHTIYSDLMGDMATWLPNQQDTTLYVDQIHPTALGHMGLGANVTAGMIAGGWQTSYSGPGYFNTDVNINGGLYTNGQVRFYGTDTFFGVASINYAYVHQIQSSGGRPTIALGAAAGTSPTGTITGSNMSGQLSITTGTSPTASAILVTIQSAADLQNTWNACTISPTNAAAVGQSLMVYPTVPGAGKWTINVAGTAVPASTQLNYAYVCF